MTRLRLTREARNDLADIRRYSLREFGREVADAYLRGLERTFRRLKVNPGLGEPAADIAEDARIYSHRHHRIVNRLSEGEITIAMIVHHARDLAVLIERLKLQ